MDELLEQLAEAVGDHQAVARFAAVRKAEADTGRTGASSDVRRTLTRQELDVLTAGFRTIRGQEPLDDVADWATSRCSRTKPRAPARTDTFPHGRSDVPNTGGKTITTIAAHTA